MKKIISLLLSISLIFTVCLILCSCGQSSSPIDDFEYEFEKGETIITGYKGSDLEIVIPDVIEDRPVTTIGHESFIGYDLTSISFPNTVTEIEGRAFYNCYSLKNITFSEGIEHISDDAFKNCENLDEVSLPDSIRYVSESAFTNTAWYKKQADGVVYSGNTALFYKGDPYEQSTRKDHAIEIYIKENTKSIADNALNDSAIKYVHIPESVTYIGDKAIYSDFVTLYGKSGSTAEIYANENDIKFVAE